MVGLGSLVIELSADTARFASDMGKAVHIADVQTRRIQKAASDVADMLKLSVAGISFGNIYQQMIDGAKEAEQASSRLTAVMRNTGAAVGVTKAEVDDLADALAQSTQFDDESLRNAAAQILIFGKVTKDQFSQALQVAADFAAFNKTDVVSSAHDVAKAMAEPEAAFKLLKSAGVSLSEQQKDQIKRMGALGDTAGQSALILATMQSAVKGTAAEINTGLTQATTSLSKAWNELMEEMGRTRSPSGFLDWVKQPLIALREIIKDLNVQQGASNGPQSGKIGGIGGRINELNGIIAAHTPKPGLSDEAYAETKIIRQLNAAMVEQQIAAERDMLKGSRSVLDVYFKDNLLSLDRYYEDRRTLIDAQLTKELRAIDEQIKIQRQTGARATTREEIAASEIKLEALTRQRAKVQRDAGTENILLTQEETRAKQTYGNELEALNIRVLQLQGNTAEAARRQVELQNQNLRERMGVNGDTAGLAKIDQLARLTVAQESFNEVNERTQRVLEDLAIQEGLIQNARRTGATSDLEALHRTDEARKETVRRLQEQYEAMKKVAEASGNPKLIQDAEKLRVKIGEIAAESDLLADKFDTIFKDNISDALTEAVMRTKSLKDAFTDMANGIVREITKIAAQDLAGRLFGGKGGVGSVFAGIFGGNAATVGASGGGGVSDVLSALAGNLLPSFDTGTPYVPYDMVAKIHQGERIVPAAENRRAGGAGGALVVNQHFAISGPMDTRSQSQIAAAAAQGVQRGRRNL